MASKDYLVNLHRQARKNTLVLTKKQDADIAKIYSNLAKDLSKAYLRKGVKGLSRVILLSKMKTVADELNALISQNTELAAQNIVDTQTKILIATFGAYQLDKKFINMCGNVARESVNYMIKGGLYKNRKGLSERIWSIVEHNGESIQDVLVKCRLMGLGSVETAKLLNIYVKGDKKAWANATKKLGSGYGSKIKANNITYEALRLGRTYIAHTSQVALMQSTQLNPFVTELQWHTSNSDRKCEQCKSMDGKIFPINKCPFDHPNGMCYQSAVIKDSPEDIGRIIGNWVNGENNPSLDKWASSMGFEGTSIIKSK